MCTFGLKSAVREPKMLSREANWRPIILIVAQIGILGANWCPGPIGAESQGNLEVSRKRSYQAHITPKSAHIALIFRSHGAHERDMNVSTFISHSPRSYCAPITLIMRSYTAHIALWARNENETRS